MHGIFSFLVKLSGAGEIEIEIAVFNSRSDPKGYKMDYFFRANIIYHSSKLSIKNSRRTFNYSGKCTSYIVLFKIFI